MTFFDFISPAFSFFSASARVKTTPIPRGINLSDSLRSYIVFPIAGYLPFPESHGYAEYADDPATDTILDQPTLTSMSFEWSVHGATFGVVFYIYPVFSSPIPPNRIEVVVPDQLEWPAPLWATLKARDSVHLRGHRVAHLPISKHLSHALRFWSSRTPDFERRYRALPFGSKIVLSRLDIDPAKMAFTFEEDTKPFHKMLSVNKLCEKWSMKESDMPPCLTVSQLHHTTQIADDVALVQLIDSELGEKTLIFKSTVDNPNPLYHELKVLLTMPPAPTIVEAPSHLVTTRFGHDCEDLVCGFLIQYYPLGSLEEILPQRRIDQALYIWQQLDWAIDITRGLLHIHEHAGRYYSDLRMDNAVLRRTEDGSESVVLIDFQQSRNLYNWAPPEIYYTEWIAELGHDDFARGPSPSCETKAYYNKILKHILSVRKYPLPLCKEPEVYDNPDQGWYFPWLMCSAEEREASQVYLLGKALWCIFEGASTPDIVLGRSYPHEIDIRFPSFQSTPEPLQDLIQNCTLGAREWLDGPLGIFRRDGKIFPLGKTGLHDEEEATTEETKAAISQIWQNEMMKAEHFVLARARHDQGKATCEDLQILHYLRRPKLREVLDALLAFRSSLI